jgi:hypothetical protein
MVTRVLVSALLGVALSAGCASAPHGPLIAMGGPAAAGRTLPGVVTEPGRLVLAPADERFSEEVLRDPAQRLMLMASLRRQIHARTRRVAEPAYQHAVRPALAHRLEAAGLRPADAESVLDDVDYSRRLMNQ